MILKLFQIKQEQYYFNLSIINEEVTLLINSIEQIFTEKLKSLLKLGINSTRYKDIFDLYYLIKCNKLDKNKTTPFNYYQYWRNIDDADVMKCIKMLTFIPLDEIREMEKWDASRINEQKEILAYELTKMVHGEEEANKAKNAAKALFSGEVDESTLPIKEVHLDNFINPERITAADILVASKLCNSKNEARDALKGKSVTIDSQVVDLSYVATIEKLKEGIVVKKGKKNFVKVILK